VDFLVRNVTGQDFELSVQALVSCNRNGYGCAAGGWWAFDTVRERGLLPASCLPYRAADGVPCTPQCAPLAVPGVDRWDYVHSAGGIPTTLDPRRGDGVSPSCCG
jgi:hypothetical protein